VQLRRSSGIFLHPTSLPGGRLDADAYRFVDWLEAAGQSWWQVLPLGPPDEFGSPYRATSAFAASPLLLAEPKARVSEREIEDFVARHPYWTGEWARFEGPSALADQVRFEREWTALRDYARKRGVRLMGDIPIYVSDEGADVEAWPELFESGEVAGAPPDALSADGQHWGNPLYDWPMHRSTGYHWWIERFRRVFELVDLARIDHFRGFVSYWAIPTRNKTARKGKWRRGPGNELFHAVGRALGELPLIAEDLGVITPAVRRLRDELHLPGIVVLLWAFRAAPSNPHALRNHRAHQVVYTSTHDTDTAAGWFESLKKKERASTGLDPMEPQWGLIEIALKSRPELAIIPAQDVLGLGSAARMNRPGETHGNWSWRLERDQLTAELAARLLAETARGLRLPN
jgi:4-alpha-glucanotransferase